jgi:hypothetical protein
MLPDALKELLRVKADAQGWTITPHDGRMREYSIKTTTGNIRYSIRITAFSAHEPGEVNSESN